jgi:hypothetical protein
MTHRPFFVFPELDLQRLLISTTPATYKSTTQENIAGCMRFFCEKGGVSLFVLLVLELICGSSHVLLTGGHTVIFYHAHGLTPTDGELFFIRCPPA